MKKTVLLTIAIFTTLLVQGQSISGTVKSTTGEPLQGATVSIYETMLGTSARQNGSFKIGDLPPGDYTVIATYVGYRPDTQKVTLQNDAVTVDLTLASDVIQKSEVVVSATRAGSNTPTAYTNVEKEDIEKMNLGQDIPFLVNQTPSVVVNSDAGAGIGYTDMRIRGTDATRINVTINGIPLNDAESQGVFWVNMPDFSSSLDNIQIQRGVGTSTNGAAAFGATVNLQTESPTNESYGEINTSYGSYNTQKYNVQFGSGLIDGKWAFDGRLSSITSDGYVDRARSNLKSYYLTGGYFGEKTTVKAVHFVGKEETYQAWYGTPEAALTGSTEDKLNYAATEGLNERQTQNLLNSDRRYNHYLYENEIDNYQQDHYQLHLTHRFSSKVSSNLSFHYTKGRGYFEQFRPNEDFSTYGLSPLTYGADTIAQTDLIRRRWLDNDFYGTVFSTEWNLDKMKLTVGGALNRYEGDHFGEIIWSEFASNSEIRDRYYDNTAVKDDGNIYAKANYFVGNNLSLFGDLQYRYVRYETEGIDSDQRYIDIHKFYSFINPKAGVNFYPGSKSKLFASVAVGNREPSRSDFLDAAVEEPTPETLIDYEAGFEKSWKTFKGMVNLYYMDYKDQLVATGELNDVGALVKTNVDESYRAGVELSIAHKPFDWLEFNANYTYSQNKIANFTEYVYDYTTGFDVVTMEHSNTDIALSPSHIAKGRLTFFPFKNAALAVLGNYVGKQYLDNTSNDNRAIDPFFVSNVRASYSIKDVLFDEIELSLLVNNIAGEKYASKGYTYTYIFGEQITRNHYYPQATRNYLASVKLRF